MLWFFFFMFFVLVCFYKIRVLLKSGTTNLDDPTPIQNTPSLPSSSSSSRSWKYHVFLSFRGEDTRKTFIGHLYEALKQRLIHTYKDDISLPRGEPVGPALLEAIDESRIAVIVFSKNYADSSWCLDELAHIMKRAAEREQIAIPIFYNVEPTEVRKQKGEFGKAFAKLSKMSVWRKLIAKQETIEFQMWRKALVDASNISGWETNNVANGYEPAVIKEIVDAISLMLLSPNSDIDEELVGMTDRVEDLIKRLEIGTGGVRMVGIWGVGGSGKTTLATSVRNKIKDEFPEGHWEFVNIRKESNTHSLKALQAKLLEIVRDIKVEVKSESDGKKMIKSTFCHSKVLILLDDVDDPKQLDALAGSHSWFGDGSRIIITTRDEHSLQNVDYVSPVRLLSQDEGNWLFKKHAYNEKEPLKDFWKLSSQVVSYAAGLPLALIVLGSLLKDKDEKEWMSALDKLKDIPPKEVCQQLKISYDGLDSLEQQLFLDIACFFRGQGKDDLVDILEALGFYPHIVIKVLIQKALITIDSNGRFDMHDLVQEMGRFIVRDEHPNNLEKDIRLWKYEEIRNMCLGNTTMENDKTDRIYPYNIDDQPLIYLKMDPKIKKKLRWLIVENGSSEAPDFLSNDLQFIDWYGYLESQFPDNFQQPTNLVVLKIKWGLQKELWNGWKFLPQLKILLLHDMRQLVSTPNFDGLPSLQKLELIECYRLEKIHPSLENHKTLKHLWVSCAPSIKNFPRIDHMKNLETLHISRLHEHFSGIPNIQSDMKNLVKLFLVGLWMDIFLASVAVHCPNLISIELHDAYGGWNHSSKLDFKLSQLTVLVHLDLSGCKWLEKFPEFPPSIVIFVANGCDRLKDVGDSIRNCDSLCQVSVRNGSILNDGDRLLQSMLQGKAIENHSMILQLQGLQIPREFRDRLQSNRIEGLQIPGDFRDGTRCTLRLPENWCNYYCGFLMYAVIKGGFYNRINPKITMKQVSGVSMGIDSQDDIVWKESVDDKETWVGYVSFGSLRRTAPAAWLNETYEAVLSFSIAIESPYKDLELCGGFGVSLVTRTSGSGPTDTSLPKYYSEIDKKKYDFKPEFEIEDDLTCTFRIPSTVYW